MDAAPRLSTGWLVAALGALALGALAVVPALGSGGLWDVIRQGFSAVCHQLPDRTFHLAGEPIALCHRCSGMLAGLATGVAVVPVLGTAFQAALRHSGQGRWLLAALAPTALDWAVGAAGIWANVPASRFSTGVLFGLVAGVIVGANLLAPASPLTTTRLAS